MLVWLGMSVPAEAKAAVSEVMLVSIQGPPFWQTRWECGDVGRQTHSLSFPLFPLKGT